MNKLCRTYIRKVKLLFPVMGKYERKYRGGLWVD